MLMMMVVVVVMDVVTFLGSWLGGRASLDYTSMNLLSSPSLDQIDSMMDNISI